MLFFRRHFIMAAASVLFSVCGTAQASFHLWQINELYSNADGSVQFIELTAQAGGQQFLANHQIHSRSGGQTKTFTFTTNLPGDSAGKTFLIGSQGFAALGLVTPDYIVPNGFLFTTNGSVDFASADTVTYPSLPTDGHLSRSRSGTTEANSPKNFAGAAGHFHGAGPDYTGVWWSANESGWGLVIVKGASGHHGVKLFHYAANGMPVWYFVPAGTQNGHTFTGTMTILTGPHFAGPFNPAQVIRQDVGNITIEFTGPASANLSYTIGGTTVSKAIAKLSF